ncbi:competence protein ComEA [Spiribacter sp. C176]|uniref:Competence protein ComEA n=1 Tax=Spiribacter salilacus TaxID=2664894 RepID=A0A6N7QPV7_9GAMM|nr:helix-hairpin-helix domain-containing protein [Spiribacter salilacus]MRH77429.1 competence protein ComEA [Spiribacter salilacus]
MKTWRKLSLSLILFCVVGAAAAVEPININEADADTLQLLSGVGPATAAAIIEDREMNGPFDSVDGLTRVSGIGEVSLEQMRESIVVE